MTTMTYNTANPMGNIIDMASYRQEEEMDVRRYVLTPVCQFQPVANPRPRRTRTQYNYASFVSTCMNLAIVAVTFVLTVELLAVV